ncbi:Hsp20/alpha crystallin family protein [Bacillus sp. FJAT-42376]|uniref:Hsp20/alpha crystallin family protein n=1 Tax=Bacillus sp. FJAT-42376 TaxID=2014076 RepID=UPI000F4FCDFB|nr:Hsp20/alpha crystallin family protein [Bacillus sp. FJAT-42376]AZB44245.1 Hsp20/alpha crystallin family protein [Bacillus sp. FJAT-42376]
MDKEKIQKWLDMTEKCQKNDFWKSIFETDSDNGSASGQSRSSETSLFPKYDLYSHEGILSVLIEIPGFKKEDFSVTLDSTKTKILFKGALHPPYSFQYRVSHERHYGEVERVIPLPFQVEKETVKSQYAFGVLELTFNKAAEEAAVSINFDESHTDGQ